MSTYTLRIPVIKCDACDNTIEGHAGVSFADLWREARMEGWAQSQLDLCPDHIAAEHSPTT